MKLVNITAAAVQCGGGVVLSIIGLDGAGRVWIKSVSALADGQTIETEWVCVGAPGG